MAERIGVFGGTFDPPHIGHLVTAGDVLARLDLDRVLMVVANDPWQKHASREITAASDRLAMVQAAVSGEDGIEACDIEIERGGPSYTVDTLNQLRERSPGAELVLVLGADAAAGLHSWERSEEVPALAELVVVERPGVTTEVPIDVEWTRVEVPRLEVSSTDLRRRVAEGRSLRHLVPAAVIDLIEQRGLYCGRR